MAYALNQIGLGSYINPNDLLPDEVLYELQLRGLNMSRAPVVEQRGLLRNMQLEELRSPRLIKSNKTILDELAVIQVKLITIRQEFELQGPRQCLLSRLRHVRLRILRLNAIDAEQEKIKEDLLDEIEFLFDHFGNPDDRTPVMVGERLGDQEEQVRVPRNPSLEFPPFPNIARSSETGAIPKTNRSTQSWMPPSGLKRQRVAFQSDQSERPLGTTNPFLLNDPSYPAKQTSQILDRQSNQPVVSSSIRQADFEAIRQPNLRSSPLLDINSEVAGFSSPSSPPRSTPFIGLRREGESDRPSAPPLAENNGRQSHPALSDQPPTPPVMEFQNESPETPTIGDNTRLRAEVSRIVENVLTNQLEGMMIRVVQGMQDLQNRRSYLNDDRRTDNPNINPNFGVAASSGLMEQNAPPQGAIRHQQTQETMLNRNHLRNATSTPVQRNERDVGQHLDPYAQSGEGRTSYQRSDNSGTDHRMYQNRIPINKWQIKFSGDPKGMSAVEFLKRVEVLARNNQVSETELLSKANFLFRPESVAEIWYYTFSHKFASWETLKYHLRLRFEVPNKDKVIEREIRERKQMPNGTFVTFMGEVERLCQQLSKPMTERTKMSILIDNMRDWYRPHLAFIDTEGINIETLCNLCYELDKSVYRSYAQRPRSYQVHCLDETDWPETPELENAEINAIDRGKSRRPTRTEDRMEVAAENAGTVSNPILCWNCRQFGHFWKDCTRNKRVFCHMCGQPEVIAMNCPNIHRNGQMRPKNESGEGN